MKNKSITGERFKYFLISSIGIIISLLLIKKFYMFSLAFYPEAIFLPYKQPYLQPGWRETTVFLGIIGMSITSILTFSIFFITKKYLKNIALLSIVISVILYGSFYIIHPNYNYENHPYIFGYMTLDGKNISNPERYFEIVEKYGFKGDSYRPFKTLDDAIKGLEFAKEKKNGLYGYVFRDVEEFGYEEIFKRYDDEYFQLYFASEMIRDLGILNKYLFENHVEKLPILINYISDAEIKKLYEEIYTGYLKLEDKDPNYNEPMYEYKNVIREIVEGIYNKKGY